MSGLFFGTPAVVRAAGARWQPRPLSRQSPARSTTSASTSVVGVTVTLFAVPQEYPVPAELAPHRCDGEADHGGRDEPVEDAPGAGPGEQPVQPARTEPERGEPYGVGRYRAHAE